MKTEFALSSLESEREKGDAFYNVYLQAVKQKIENDKKKLNSVNLSQEPMSDYGNTAINN
jgi:hypothetical protein